MIVNPIDILRQLKIRLAIYRPIDRINTCLKIFFLYISIVGIFGFSAFCLEESIQLLSFSMFSASDTRQYALMKNNLELAEEINDKLKFITTWFLWALPPQLGYFYYSKATDAYIKTLKAEIIANDPEVYLGEKLNIVFRYDSYSAMENNLWVAENSMVRIILKTEPQSKTVNISGIVHPDPNKKSGVIIIAD